MASLIIGPLGLVTRLFRWWVGELAGLVPSWLKRRLAGTTDRVVLLPGDGEAALYLESSQELTLLGRVALDPESDAVRRVGAILGRHALDRAIAAGRATLCLRIPADRALRTTMDLPLAAEKNSRRGGFLRARSTHALPRRAGFPGAAHDRAERGNATPHGRCSVGAAQRGGGGHGGRRAASSRAEPHRHRRGREPACRIRQSLARGRPPLRPARIQPVGLWACGDCSRSSRSLPSRSQS